MSTVLENPKDNERCVLRTQATWLILALAGSWCRAMDPSVGYPIGPSTIPPSSISNDLVPTSNPIDTSQDLVITGNVTAGKQFRGFVPYGSTTAFRTSLGSAYLDSFLRYSQGALDASPWSGDITPFYSPTATVTRMLPGSIDPIVPQAGLAWMVPSSTEPEMLTDLSTAMRLGKDPVAALWSSKVTQTDQPPWVDSSVSIQRGQPILPVQDGVQPVVPQQGAAPLPTIQDGPDANQPVNRALAGVDHVLDRGLARGASDDPCEIRPAQWQGMERPSPQIAQTTPWIGSLDAFWQARYEQCMATASPSLREGKPQQAVDAWSLAIVYKPGDTLALVGKSHALFTCGEFARSALFLARALEICPDYAKMPVDLARLVGGEGILRSRIEEGRNYLGQTDSIELRFILAYVLYRTGDLFGAQEIIGPILDKTDRWPAIRIVKEAIDLAYSRGPQ